MTRGLYISLAVLGLLLTLAAGVSAVAAIAPPGWDRAAIGVEAGAAVVGLCLTWAGFAQARAASEYGMRVSGRSRRRAEVVAVPTVELAFDCPGCGRTYRATAQMAGRPFACRVCDARFTVPRGT